MRKCLKSPMTMHLSQYFTCDSACILFYVFFLALNSSNSATFEDAGKNPVKGMPNPSSSVVPFPSAEQVGKNTPTTEKKSAGHNLQVEESPKQHGGDPQMSPKSATFKRLVKSGRPFVDKTLFIAGILQNKNTIVAITRPRGFGKTINLSMLNYFFNIQENPGSDFTNLKICTETDYCNRCLNKYPIIHLDLSELKGETYQDSVVSLKLVIANLFKQHSYLNDSVVLKGSPFWKRKYAEVLAQQADESTTTKIVRLLSEMMFHHYNKMPIILIDGYDTALYRAFNCGFHRQMAELVGSLLHFSLKRNTYFMKAVVGGISRAWLNDLLPDLSNGIFTVFDAGFSEYFGFTTAEVEGLTSKYSLSKLNLTDLAEMYQGYHIGESQLYNPWSVVRCLRQKGSLEKYWVVSAPDGELGKYFLRGVLPGIGAEALLRGVPIVQKIRLDTGFDDLKVDNAAFWTFITELGYLTVSQSILPTAKVRRVALQIPNGEIRGAFEDALLSVRKRYGLAPYSALESAFCSRNNTGVEHYLKACLQDVKNLFGFSGLDNQEKLNGFMTVVLKGLESVFGPSTYVDSGGEFFILMGSATKTTDYFVFVVKKVSADENFSEPDEAAKNGILAQVKQHFQKCEKKYKSVTVFMVKYASKKRIKVFNFE